MNELILVCFDLLSYTVYFAGAMEVSNTQWLYCFAYNSPKIEHYSFLDNFISNNMYHLEAIKINDWNLKTRYVFAIIASFLISPLYPSWISCFFFSLWCSIAITYEPGICNIPFPCGTKYNTYVFASHCIVINLLKFHRKLIYPFNLYSSLSTLLCMYSYFTFAASFKKIY